MLEMRLLGNFCLWYQGVVLPVKTPALRELLCYLILNTKQIRREMVATDLWGETTSDALKKLRQHLWLLRTWLNEHQISEFELRECENHDTLQLEVRGDVKIDVLQLRTAGRLFGSGMPIKSTDISLLEQSVSFDQTELLEGCHAEWCLRERERYRDLMGSILERLIAECQKHACWSKAFDYAQKALQLEPDRESVHYQVICLYVRRGDFVGALRQFERCTRALREAFGVGPCAATQALMNFGTPPSSPANAGAYQDLLERVLRIQQTLTDLVQRLEKT